MAVTYGFYNSKNGDRKYDTEQVSRLFDGLITEGVFMSIADRLMVSKANGMIVHVKPGRAWFQHSWTLNNTILPLTLTAAEVILNRWDAIVLECNANVDVRANTIKVITGVPATAPQKPTLINDGMLRQVPLAYIYVKPNVTEIVQADITNCVGTSECPFVTGVVTNMNIDALIARWESEFDVWMLQNTSDFTGWMNQSKSAFDVWFDTIKGQLDSDVAGSLNTRINDLTVVVNKKADANLEGKALDTIKLDGFEGQYYNRSLNTNFTSSDIKTIALANQGKSFRVDTTVAGMPLNNTYWEVDVSSGKIDYFTIRATQLGTGQTYFMTYNVGATIQWSAWWSPGGYDGYPIEKISADKGDLPYDGTADFNNYTQVGIYRSRGGAGYNRPPNVASTYGVLTVSVSGGYVQQIYTCLNGTATQAFIRQKTTDWGSWIPITPVFVQATAPANPVSDTLWIW